MSQYDVGMSEFRPVVAVSGVLQRLKEALVVFNDCDEGYKELALEEKAEAEAKCESFMNIVRQNAIGICDKMNKQLKEKSDESRALHPPRRRWKKRGTEFIGGTADHAYVVLNSKDPLFGLPVMHGSRNRKALKDLIIHGYTGPEPSSIVRVESFSGDPEPKLLEQIRRVESWVNIYVYDDIVEKTLVVDVGNLRLDYGKIVVLDLPPDFEAYMKYLTAGER